MKTWSQMIREFMRAGGQTTKGENQEQSERYASHIEEEVKELIDAFYEGDKVKAIDGACDLIVVCCGFMYSQGIYPDDVMLAVLSANARKIVDGKVYRREDGQIGKPPGWYGPEREISEFVRIAAHEARGIE